MYKPKQPFNVAARIIPTVYEKINGVNAKRAFYHVWVSVKNSTRVITVYKDDAVCAETLWVRTKYKSPRSETWTDEVSRAITGTYTASYTTEGITYDVAIYRNEAATEPLCRLVVSDGQVRDSADDYLIYVSARSFGGTEKTTNDTWTILDTIEIETWYRPDITSVCRLKLLDDNSVWEIKNTPEDIDRRHQFLKFTCERVKGNA